MNKIPQPSFLVFAKRKNSADIYCDIYVRVKYTGGVHEKSLGFNCLYEHWNSKEQTMMALNETVLFVVSFCAVSEEIDPPKIDINKMILFMLLFFKN